MGKREGKVKGNIKKIFMAIFLIAFLILILIYFIHQLRVSTLSFTIKRGRLADEELVKAIFIRKEEILGEENSKRKLEKIKSEGTRVAKGDDVFRFYSNDEQDLIKKVEELNQEINKYLQNQKINIKSPENQVINEHIRQIINEINTTTSQAKIKEKLNIISGKLQEKSKDGQIFKSDENINRLNREKRELEERLTKNTKTLKSPFAGIVSYKIDGLENKLKADVVDTLTSEEIKKMDIKPGVQIATSDTNGKVVDNFETYLAVETNNKNIKNKKVGEYIKVRIYEDTINAEIVKLPNANVKNDKLMVLKITENVEKLIDTRSAYIDLIWWEKEGLKISNRAIEKEKGFHFVVKNKWTYKEKVMVKIVKETEDFSLVENYTSEELRKMGIDITNKRPYIQEDDEIMITTKSERQEDKEKNAENTKKAEE